MTVILIVVYSKGLKGFVGLAIGGMAGLGIFFLSFISFIYGASMNPARSLAPALLSGVVGNLWIYRTATFVGTSLIAFIFRSHF
jgi:aquaporin Z